MYIKYRFTFPPTHPQQSAAKGEIVRRAENFAEWKKEKMLKVEVKVGAWIHLSSDNFQAPYCFEVT